MKEVRSVNEECDKLLKLRRKDEEENAELRKELGQIKLEK